MTHMRWQCQSKGCYLQRRTDPVMFDGCFPAGVSMGDVDGIVELNGHVLIAEFKRTGTILSTGQKRLHQNLLTPASFTTFVVHALEQHVTGWTVFSSKYPEGHRCEGDSDDLREMVRKWSAKAAPERTPQRLTKQQRPAS